jgi:hypothetical protein
MNTRSEIVDVDSLLRSKREQEAKKKRRGQM